MMTVNELIEKLKEYGSEKERDNAYIRIVNSDGVVLDDNIDLFDVKYGVNNVDIPVYAQ